MRINVDYPKNNYKRGKLNKITDIEGIEVGHFTVSNQINNTGITVIKPVSGDFINEKLLARSTVINGFGKSIGLLQVEELSHMESLLCLTNTLAVGRIADFLVRYTAEQYKKNNKDLKTFNPLVFECNDSTLNDISDIPFTYENFIYAINDLRKDFKEGDVGAGKGMSAYQFKGGIGSSSRIVNLDKDKYTIGTLVLSNHGLMTDLQVSGQDIGRKIYNIDKPYTSEDKGSIIVIIATDIPLNSTQLKRVSNRAVVGLSRGGSFIGHGSGEIVHIFSTKNKIVDNDDTYKDYTFITDKVINEVFRATVESVEESVLKSMLNSSDVIHKDKYRNSIMNYIKINKQNI